MSVLMEAPPPLGEERELPVGSLVAWRSPYFEDGRVLLARVHYQPTNHSPYFSLTMVHTGEYFTEHDRRRLVWVTSEVWEQDSRVRTLAQRIAGLRDNLQETTLKLEERRKGNDHADLLLLQRFSRLLSTEGVPAESHWFWSLVGESLDSPRQLSWAPTMAFADNNKRRRRGSVCKFLLGAGAEHGARFTREEAERIGFLCGYHLPESYRYEFVIKSGYEGQAATYLDSEDGFGSCMSGKRYTAFYAANPAKVSFVRIEHNGRYVGRSLLWTADCGTKLLDKVYCRSQADISALRDYAKEQNWLVDWSGYVVTMRPSPNGEYPYIDSFRYTNDRPDNSSLITLSDEEGDYAFDATDGSWSGEETPEYTCDQCGTGLNEDELYTHEYDEGGYCERCYSRLYQYLNYKHDGKQIIGDYSRNEISRCGECREYRLDDHIQDFKNDSYCEDCWERISECKQCGEERRREDMKEFDGFPYCEDCWGTCDQCGEEYGGSCDCWKGKELEKREPCRFTLPLPLEFAC